MYEKCTTLRLKYHNLCVPLTWTLDISPSTSTRILGDTVKPQRLFLCNLSVVHVIDSARVVFGQCVSFRSFHLYDTTIVTEFS